MKAIVILLAALMIGCLPVGKQVKPISEADTVESYKVDDSKRMISSHIGLDVPFEGVFDGETRR